MYFINNNKLNINYIAHGSISTYLVYYIMCDNHLITNITYVYLINILEQLYIYNIIYK